MYIRPEGREDLVLYAADVLGDIGFDGITQMEPADVRALNRSMQTPNGSWENAALCLTEPNIIAFEVIGRGKNYADATEICGQCTVRAQCLLGGLETEANPQTMRAGLRPKEFIALRGAAKLGTRMSRSRAVVAINSMAQTISDRRASAK